jgi:uncharacterized protein YbjT (DUF2867 family)
MRILLTGASGFVGSTLAPRLLAEGHELRALARDPARTRSVLAQTGRRLEASGADDFTGAPPPPAEIEIVQGDVLNGEGLQRALRGIEVT